MSRLTIRTENGATLKLDNPQNEAEARKQLHDKYLIAIEKLAHYEDLEEQGKLIELPCLPFEPIFICPKDGYFEGCVIPQVIYKNTQRILKDIEAGFIFGHTQEEVIAKLKELEG